MKPKSLRAGLFFAIASLVFPGVAQCAQSIYEEVTPHRTLGFPGDHGSHPGFRIEWWYLTGWLRSAGGEGMGFQITFFRHRTGRGETNPSAFAPRQILVAHSALSLTAEQRMLTDERVSRTGLGAAEAEQSDLRVWIDHWSLTRTKDGYRAFIPAKDFTLRLNFTATQPLLLQGEGGFSRKGPGTSAASYYYSHPQLQVAGTVERNGTSQRVSGSAWLDHEWSSTLLDPEASGWDWVGANMDDGSAFMAFRIRHKNGQDLFRSGVLRDATGRTRQFKPQEVRFIPQRHWQSPTTGGRYPIETVVQLGASSFRLVPLFDNQEFDAARSVGMIYWEGAVKVQQDGNTRGHGYLELTGYHRSLASPANGPLFGPAGR